MNLTTVLTLASTVVVAGIITRFGFTEKTQTPPEKDVVAYVGAKEKPAERDVVAELLGARVSIEEPVATDLRTTDFVTGSVTAEEVEAAKRRWKQRLDRAMAINARAKAKGTDRTNRREVSKPRPRRRARVRRDRSDSRRTLFQRARKIVDDNRTYGLPYRKRASRRIRTNTR